MRKFWLVFCAVWMLVLGCSCEKVEKDRLSYREKDFCAVLEGCRDGEKFACEVSCKGGKMEKISYTGSGVLAGVSITAEGDGYLMERNGIRAEFSAAENALEGLLEPVRLLLLEGAEICTVQRIAEGELLTVKFPESTEEITLTVGENGFPLVITCQKYSIQVRILAEEDAG